MSYIINEFCISCGTCEAECPTNAIIQGDRYFVINPDLCVECGSCAKVCPVDAAKKD